MHFVISSVSCQLIFVYALCAFAFYACFFIYICTVISPPLIICSPLEVVSDGSTCFRHCMLSASGSIKILYRGGTHNIFVLREMNSVIDYCVFCSSYPERDELKSIYNIYMSSIMGMCLPKHQIWKSSSKIANLTGSMIKIYEEVLADIFMLIVSRSECGVHILLRRVCFKIE
jgi:hypothetical protein